MARIPKLCWHRGTEQAYARFDGRQIYFGRWPASQKTPPEDVVKAYEQALTLWLRRRAEEQPNKRPTGPYPLITELFAAYLTHCKLYYRKHGRETSEVGVISRACRIADRLFGERYAHEFSALRLKEVRAEMIRKGWARESINKSVQRVIAMWRWGSENGLGLTDVLAELRTVAPLKYGRTTARETAKVRPAVMEAVRETLSHMRDPFPDMVEVHYLLGCRAAEVVCVRVREIHHDARGWRFEPETWKTEHHERERLIHWIGPRALAIIKRRMKGKGKDDYLFPCFRARSGRQRDGAKKSCYTTASYRRAVAEACRAHGLAKWSPIQIRKARLTDIAAAFDLEAARLSVCHRKISTTQLYAAANQTRAREVAAAMG